MEVKHILLDMDGVISDFHTACLRRHGWEKVQKGETGLILENSQGSRMIYPYGEWEIGKALHLSDDAVWKPLDGIFKYLEPTSQSFNIINLIESTGIPWTISTSPGHEPSNYADKVCWFRHHFRPNANNFMIGSRKYLMANPYTLLIDDGEHNVEAFEKAGGQTFLWPGYWNKLHNENPRNAFRELEKRLRAIK